MGCVLVDEARCLKHKESALCMVQPAQLVGASGGLHTPGAGSRHAWVLLGWKVDALC